MAGSQFSKYLSIVAVTSMILLYAAFSKYSSKSCPGTNFIPMAEGSLEERKINRMYVSIVDQDNLVPRPLPNCQFKISFQLEKKVEISRASHYK